MSELIPTDLTFVVQRLPQDVREMLKDSQLYVGGGFIRAVVAGEEASDIDIFGPTKDALQAAAAALAARRPGSKLHTTDNAITLLSPERMPVQFITRWNFHSAFDLTKSFDFTVCQAAVWRDLQYPRKPWRSAVSHRFYVDLAARRLVYTSPVREEEAGGSMLRVMKYVKRGYNIQVDSLGAVIARLADKVDRQSSVPSGKVIAGLLREVDPLLVIDGMEMINDHEPVETWV